MSIQNLSGKKAAFLVDNGFCEREFKQTEKALSLLGMRCETVSPSSSMVLTGWNEKKDSSESDWGDEYAIDQSVNQAVAGMYDVLVIPGGKRSIEKLELSSDVRGFLGHFFQTRKPVIAYNNAISLLVFHSLVSGYSLAAKDKICDTAKTAGGRCAQPELVVSKNLITLSRFRDVDDRIQRAVLSVFNGEPYVEKIVEAAASQSSHKAA